MNQSMSDAFDGASRRWRQIKFSWMFAPTPSRRRVEGVYHSVVDSRAGKIQMIQRKPSSRGRRRPEKTRRHRADVHPRHREMDTIHEDGVKAPQHRMISRAGRQR